MNRRQILLGHGLTLPLKNGLLMKDDVMSQSKHTLDDLRIHRPAEHSPRSKTWLAVSVVVLVLLAGAGVWSRVRSSAVEVPTALARESLSGGGGGSGSERTVLNASGYVTARRRATVS